MHKNQVRVGLVLVLFLPISILVFCDNMKKRSTIGNLESRVAQLTVRLDEARGDARQREKVATDAFLRDYKLVFTMLREREINIYNQLVVADSNILANVEKIRHTRQKDPFAKWRKYQRNYAGNDDYMQMEGRLISMLKNEIRYCGNHMRKLLDGEEEMDEYSRELKTYPTPLFFEPDPNDK